MQTPLREKRGAQAGITLIELLISMIILTIVSTMLVGGWISLQRSFAFAQATNTARATARDALDRVSSELRDCQPPTTGGSPFTSASPYRCVFYSSYNQAGASADGTGNKSTVLLLTRIYLDQKTLYWQRDTNGSGTFTSADRTIVLATNVVNDASTLNVPIFTYGYKDTSGNYATATTMADPSKIISVQVRLVVDANLSHTPKYVDLTTTVRPRNAGSN